MDSPVDLLKEIEDKCKIYFENSTFHFKRSTLNKWRVIGDYSSKAIIRGTDEVNVVKWFSDFWVYLEVEFGFKGKNFPKIFVTLSVLQGEEDDNVKNHLFRAEWDNYDDNKFHPQPHWHLYPVKYHHEIQEDFETFIDIAKEEGFASKINSQRKSIIDLKRIHFAMNAHWNIQGGHIHEIKDEDTLINWLQGLLGHIKQQLEYMGG